MTCVVHSVYEQIPLIDFSGTTLALLFPKRFTYFRFLTNFIATPFMQ
jgi:hypothetical protein